MCILATHFSSLAMHFFYLIFRESLHKETQIVSSFDLVPQVSLEVSLLPGVLLEVFEIVTQTTKA